MDDTIILIIFFFKKSGFGKLENIDGSSYEGNWADDRREGAGVWKCAGEEYDGYWHSDKVNIFLLKKI